MITRNTQLFGSFSENPSDFGATVHNAAFEHYGVDAIYKPFRIHHNRLEDAFMSMQLLDIRGVGVSAPFKCETLKLTPYHSPEVSVIGAANTIVALGAGVYKLYNTDCFSIDKMLTPLFRAYDQLYVLGNGGFSKAVQYVARLHSIKCNLIMRHNWNELGSIKNSLIFNATTVKNIAIHPSNHFIDCHLDTKTGQTLALEQASAQFKIYTGLEFPMHHVLETLFKKGMIV